MMEDKEFKTLLDSLAECFNCTICCHLLTKPSQNPCGHIFCSDCIKNIERAEKGDAKCPICRRKLTRRGVKVRDDIVELSLAVRYLEQTVVKELMAKNNQIQQQDSSASADQDLVDDDTTLSSSPHPPMLSVAQTENHAVLDKSLSPPKLTQYQPCTIYSSLSKKNMVHSAVPLSEIQPIVIVSSSVESQPKFTDTQPIKPPEIEIQPVVVTESIVKIDNSVPQTHQSPSSPLSTASLSPTLTLSPSQSQPLDLVIINTNNVHSSPSVSKVIPVSSVQKKNAIQFLSPLNLSRKRSHESSTHNNNNDEELNNKLHQQNPPTGNISRRHPIFLLHDDRNSFKRQKIDFVEQKEQDPRFGNAIFNNVDLRQIFNDPNSVKNKLAKQPKCDKRQKETNNNVITTASPLQLEKHRQEPEHHKTVQEQSRNDNIKTVESIELQEPEEKVIEKVVSQETNNNNNHITMFEFENSSRREEMEINIIPITTTTLKQDNNTPELIEPETNNNFVEEVRQEIVEEVLVEDNMSDHANQNEEIDKVDENNDDESSSSDEDQVIPSTPVKSKTKSICPSDSSGANNNNDNNNTCPRKNEEEEEVAFNSRSTFASPLPSQLNLSFPFEPSQPKTQPRKKFVFCPSRLNRVELAKLSDLCTICDGTISKEYTDEVTHLIIKLEKGRVPQTMKYLFAIADKKWIVVFDWVLECAMQAEMVSEDPYESSSFPDCDSGVRNSRLNPNEKLLTGATFFFPTILKCSGASLDDCKKLVEKMGGTIVNSPYEVDPNSGLIIIGDGINTWHLYQDYYMNRGCLSVHWSWILDCLLTFSVIPFAKTHVLTKLDGSNSIKLPESLKKVNRCTPLSAHFSRPSTNVEVGPD